MSEQSSITTISVEWETKRKLEKQKDLVEDKVKKHVPWDNFFNDVVLKILEENHTK